jgi:hypothetical protein
MMGAPPMLDVINLNEVILDRRCMAVRKSLVALSTYYDEMSKQQVFDTCQVIMNEMLDIIIELSERDGCAHQEA